MEAEVLTALAAASLLQGALHFGGGVAHRSLGLVHAVFQGVGLGAYENFDLGVVSHCLTPVASSQWSVTSKGKTSNQ